MSLLKSLLLNILLVQSASGFVVSRRTGANRLFGLHRSASVASTVEAAGLADDGTDGLSADVLGNRASEWFLPRIGGLKPLVQVSEEEEDEDDDLPDDFVTSVEVVESRADLADFLGHDNDQLSLVFYHASWCKTCQRFSRRYKKISSLYSDKLDPSDDSVVEEGRVRMASVEYGANMELCDALDVETLPLVRFYRAGVQIDELVVPADKFDQVQKLVEDYLEEEDLESILSAGRALLTEIMLDGSDESNLASTTM